MATAKQKGLVGVQYVGKKPMKRDNVAETNLVWLPGEIHKVEILKAAILLQYTDIWAKDPDDDTEVPSVKKARSMVVSQPVEPEDESALRNEQMMPDIHDMSVEQLVAIAKQRYDEDLNPQHPLPELRARVIALENLNQD